MIPGLSRSGSTITTSLLLGLRREDAAIRSWLTIALLLGYLKRHSS